MFTFLAAGHDHLPSAPVDNNLGVQLLSPLSSPLRSSVQCDELPSLVQGHEALSILTVNNDVSDLGGDDEEICMSGDEMNDAGVLDGCREEVTKSDDELNDAGVLGGCGEEVSKSDDDTVRDVVDPSVEEVGTTVGSYPREGAGTLVSVCDLDSFSLLSEV